MILFEWLQVVFGSRQMWVSGAQTTAVNSKLVETPGDIWSVNSLGEDT